MTPPTPDPAFRWTAEPWGLVLRCIPLEPIAQHAFTSRQLRLPRQPTLSGTHLSGLDRAPDPGVGWDLAAASVGATPDRLRRARQVHGNLVRVLSRGRQSAADVEARPDADAIASNEAGLALAVVVADCVPILIAARRGGSAAAVHAGWRGTCAAVAPAAVRTMATEFGAAAEDLTVAIGPSIGPGDYDVGEALVGAFLAAGHSRADVDRWFLRSEDRLRLDLWAANRDQLVAAGVRPECIFTSGLSSLAHPGVFDSFRRDGERAGRTAALIVVPRPVPAAGA